jgi:histidinol phosphatase-like PHP family hydrolase
MFFSDGILSPSELVYRANTAIAITDHIDHSNTECRDLGAKVVVVHGETIEEVVPEGTNLAVAKAKVDILAHPGHLSYEIAFLAAKNNVKIEITTKTKHGTTNKEVAQIALKNRAKLIMNTDTHEPEHLLTEKRIIKVLTSAGLTDKFFDEMQKNSLEIVNKGVL